MRKLNALKISKDGKPYLEIDAEALLHLEWSIGDRILLEFTDPWMYDRTTKTCTLTNITKEEYRNILKDFGFQDVPNSAPNREPLPDT